MIYKQKYWRGTKVKVVDEMPKHMGSFRGGMEAIVMHSSRDNGVCLCTHPPSYCLVYVCEDGGLISGGWYEEYLLTLVDGDRDSGEKVLRKYIGEVDE